MEENLALKLLRILRRNSKGEPLTDVEVRKLARMDQTAAYLARVRWERTHRRR